MFYQTNSCYCLKYLKLLFILIIVLICACSDRTPSEIFNNVTIESNSVSNLGTANFEENQEVITAILTEYLLSEEQPSNNDDLMPGDIAIIGVNTDNDASGNDSFNFLTLRGIPANTKITFTDSGIKDDGTFRGLEGAVAWQSATFTPKGTVISYIGVGGDFTIANDVNVGTVGFALSDAGDQIIAFIAASDSPKFIYALQTNSSNWQSTSTSDFISALPPGLIISKSAVGLGNSGELAEIDNAKYNQGVTSGTKDELLTVISNKWNWFRSNTRFVTLPTGPYMIND